MTPTEITDAARYIYNAAGSNFWTASEMLTYLLMGCGEMARYTRCIEATLSTSTVASQQEYDWPTYAMIIKRITYAGQKLQPITKRQYDSMNITGATVTGTPRYYYCWDRVFVLHPTPAAVGTLKVWTYNFPQTITASSTLEVPIQWHPCLVDFLVWRMALKEKNFPIASAQQSIWQGHLQQIRSEIALSKGSDGPGAVESEECLPFTQFGTV